MLKTRFIPKLTLSAMLAIGFFATTSIAPVRLEAQATSGDLVGTVTDASGAVVPNATVEATNNATGVKSTTVSNGNGEYRFSNLLAGSYNLSVSGNGLTGAKKNITVELNKTATANVSTGAATTSTTVEVSDQATAIDTTTAQIQNTFEIKQTQDLPTAAVGLGVLNLSLLNAGVASSGGIGAGTGPSISGQRPRNNNFTVEGVDNNSKSVTGPLLVVPNDAVQNFTVLQNQFTPEFGHSSGGQFNEVILSGTNKFHGRVYEYFQNRNLNAVDAITRVHGQTSNPRYDNNRFGGQLGGPIWKDKLFFFSNLEYNPIGQALTSSACAPTAAGYAAIAGYAAASGTSISTNNLNIYQKYVPTPSGPSPANSQVCPSSATYYVPQPGYTPGDFNPSDPNSFTNAVYSPTPVGTYEVGQDNFSGSLYSNTLTSTNSIDLNLSNADQIRFRYIFQRNSALDAAAQLPAFWLISPTRNHLLNLSEYHTFSASVNNELRIGFNHYSNYTNVPAIGFPGLAQFPNLSIDEFNVNVGPDPNGPQFGVQNTYQLVDNVSWIKGKHNFKFGAEGRKYISPQGFTQRQRGDYYWSTLGYYLQDIFPDDFGERSTGNFHYPGDQYAIYAYGNDEWRVTPSLTVNLGLRYEFTDVTAGNKLQSANSAASFPGLVSFTAPIPQKKNFAPRIGFAYSPGTSGNTSIRGGFGIAYDVLYDNLGILSFPPQFSGTCDVGNVPSATCFYSSTAFLANQGLPAGNGGLQTFPDVITQRENTSAYVPNQSLPYSESWNLGVEHIFAGKYTAEVRYVGTKGIHLPVQARLNRQAKTTATLFLPTYTTAPDQATLDALPITLNMIKANSNYKPDWAAAGFDGASVVGFENYGSSIYHGLQTELKRQFTNGLQFQAAWTWSHAEDNSTADVFSTVLTPRRPQDWNCFACDMSTSALDRRHRVTVEMIYDAPWFKNSNWLAKNVLGNWEVAPIYTFQSPEYFTVQSGVDTNQNGDAAGDRAIFNPAGVPGTGTYVTPLKNTAGATVAYLAANPNAQYIQAGIGAKATASRNTLALPHENNFDLTAVKRFHFTESTAFEFQAQAFNVFNHSQYLPGSINQINSIGYTDPQTTSFVRVTKASVTSGAFNNVKGTFSNQARTMQLVAKFIF